MSTKDRALIAPGAAAGVTEEMIQAVVHAFYARVRRDADLGPIFNRVIGEGWDEHLEKLCDFWSSVLLMTGRFKGAPMAVHVRLADIAPKHFDLWLGLFEKTVTDLCPPEAAALFLNKARTIGASFQYGIAASRGVLPGQPWGPASS